MLASCLKSDIYVYIVVRIERVINGLLHKLAVVNELEIFFYQNLPLFNTQSNVKI